jgi:hypothetical protein
MRLFDTCREVSPGGSHMLMMDRHSEACLDGVLAFLAETRLFRSGKAALRLGSRKFAGCLRWVTIGSDRPPRRRPLHPPMLTSIAA